MIRICFVCLGNICRSPTAEAIMKKIVADANLDSKIQVDSAGTAAYHAGENADPRSRATAKRYGITINQRARQFQVEDFDNFDYVVAMDNSNLRVLQRLAADSNQTKLHLMRAFDKPGFQSDDVPDPYCDNERGFDEVFQICLRCCSALLHHICTTHELPIPR